MDTSKISAESIETIVSLIALIILRINLEIQKIIIEAIIIVK